MHIAMGERESSPTLVHWTRGKSSFCAPCLGVGGVNLTGTTNQCECRLGSHRWLRGEVRRRRPVCCGLAQTGNMRFTTTYLSWTFTG